MKMRRIVFAESKDGAVVRTTDMLDTEATPIGNVWGFDDLPRLPLRPEQVLADYKGLGIFGPKNSVRVDIMSLAPEKAGKAPDLGGMVSDVDMGTGGGMTQGMYGGGMHRTDTIDLNFVLRGETDIDYPGEDGQIRTVAVKEGDLVVMSAFHEWRNRSNAECVVALFVFAADRTTA